jgi:hypothetical protein
MGILLIILRHCASNFFPFPAGSMHGIRIVSRAFGFILHVLFMWWHMASRTVARQEFLSIVQQLLHTFNVSSGLKVILFKGLAYY